MRYADRIAPLGLTMNVLIPPAEVEAARRRVIVKRAIRRELRRLGIEGVRIT